MEGDVEMLRRVPLLSHLPFLRYRTCTFMKVELYVILTFYYVYCVECRSSKLW